jgi:hypothetical protein
MADEDNQHHFDVSELEEQAKLWWSEAIRKYEEEDTIDAGCIKDALTYQALAAEGRGMEYVPIPHGVPKILLEYLHVKGTKKFGKGRPRRDARKRQLMAAVYEEFPRRKRELGSRDAAIRSLAEELCLGEDDVEKAADGEDTDFLGLPQQNAPTK